MKKLTVDNISKSYAGRKIIENISFEVSAHETISLLGTSGVGKTTLFNIIAGIVLPEKGRIILDNKDITGQPAHVGYMPQKDLLLPHKTIIDNISLPLIISGMDKKSAYNKIVPYLERFSLAGCENKYPSQLSGGMRQRAALLRTHMYDDDFLLLDEPFSSLDSITKSILQQWYFGIVKDLGTSAIFITHDIDEAIMLSDRIYVMAGSPGKIETSITINRPDSGKFFLSPKFVSYKQYIIDHFHVI